MLAILACCPAWRLMASPLPRARCGNPFLLAEEPSWWDKLVYGRQGPPLPPPPPLQPLGLWAVFDQWDTNKNGKLEMSELNRALLAVGLDPEDITGVLEVLGANAGVTYEELDARLSPELRASIEARLNKDGVMESLYVPPEKWVDETSAEAFQRDQRIQFDALRNGNKGRQNDIIGKELGKG